MEIMDEVKCRCHCATKQPYNKNNNATIKYYVVERWEWRPTAWPASCTVFRKHDRTQNDSSYVVRQRRRTPLNVTTLCLVLSPEYWSLMTDWRPLLLLMMSSDGLLQCTSSISFKCWHHYNTIQSTEWNEMVVTTPSTIMPPPTCDTQNIELTRPKSAFWGIFDPDPWLQNLTHSSRLPETPLTGKVWSNSVNKYARYHANKVCLGWMHEHSRNNAFSHYIGGGIKMPVASQYNRLWKKRRTDESKD